MTSAVDSLTIEEFSDLLCDLIESHGFEVDREASIDLTVGVDLVSWRYPAVIVCNKADVNYVFVVRFGPKASLPGYLVKYLHAARTADATRRLVIACRESAAAAYGAICGVYGLGVLECSVRQHRVLFRSEPREVDIGKAFDLLVRRILDECGSTAAREIDEVNKHADNFKAEAKRSGFASRDIEFEAQRAKIQHWVQAITELGERVRASKSFDELRELQKLYDEGPT